MNYAGLTLCSSSPVGRGTLNSLNRRFNLCFGESNKNNKQNVYIGTTLDESSLSGEAIALILNNIEVKLGFLYRHTHLLSEKTCKTGVND